MRTSFTTIITPNLRYVNPEFLRDFASPFRTLRVVKFTRAIRLHFYRL